MRHVLFFNRNWDAPKYVSVAPFLSISLFLPPHNTENPIPISKKQFSTPIVFHVYVRYRPPPPRRCAIIMFNALLVSKLSTFIDALVIFLFPSFRSIFPLSSLVFDNHCLRFCLLCCISCFFSFVYIDVPPRLRPNVFLISFISFILLIVVLLPPDWKWRCRYPGIAYLFIFIKFDV